MQKRDRPARRDQPMEGPERTGGAPHAKERERRPTITPKMIEAGLYELACWHDPMTPICDVSSDALAGAYIAMVRSKFR
jgi:hypothetical protein